MSKLTDEQKIEIVEKYKNGNCSCASLGREYGVDRGAVNKILRNRNVEIINDRSILYRKYQIDESYFDVIDTEDKSYFLGLMYADGCNHNDCNSFSLGLHEEDKEILDKFNNALKSNYKLGHVKPKAFLSKRTQKVYQSSGQYVLCCTSKNICSQLSRLGCVPQKTFLLEFPTEEQVPKHLLRHFMRGYFDGDGSFTLGKRKNYDIYISAEIVSTLEFCNGVKKLWFDELGINSNTYRKKHQTHNTHSLQIGGRLQVYPLLKWMYSDCEFYLKRKYDKFIEIEKILEQKGYISL